MPEPTTMHNRPRIAAVLTVLTASTAGTLAQSPPNTIDPLMHGALVFHGNYCGPGNKGAHPAPVDALDAACMRHDACVKDFEVPSCACNDRLAAEAKAVVDDADAPADERRDAAFTAKGATLLPCRR